MIKKGIIFDFDGVIINSIEVQKIAFNSCYKELDEGNSDAAFDEFLRYGGDSLENIFSHMNLPNYLVDKYREISVSEIDRITVYPEIVETLRKLCSMPDLELCLFTGKDSKRTKQLLEKLELSHYFSHVICSDQLKNPKPDSEGILKFVKETEIEKENVVMIGDSPNDILCANNAGIKSIAVLWGNPGSRLEQMNPTKVIKFPENLFNSICNLMGIGVTDTNKSIAVINGPNMNCLGKREKQFYGERTLEQIEDSMICLGKEGNCNIIFFQSNGEDKIVNFIQQNFQRIDGIIINPAALTINGYSILEALNLFEIPFIEVHMSNIYNRESWHSKSIFSPYSLGTITGLQELVYTLALQVFIKRSE